MKKLFAFLPLFLFIFSAQAQKKMISASVENNVVVDGKNNLGHVKWEPPAINQTRIVVNYGRSVIPNGFVTVGLGFEVLAVDVLHERQPYLISFASRRLLLPVAFRYSIPVKDKLSISGQVGGQLGLFLNGTGTFINMGDRSFQTVKKGLFSTVTGDVNFAIGIDRKLNANNTISITPDANVCMTNLLKPGYLLQPVSLGIKVGYIHLF